MVCPTSDCMKLCCVSPHAFYCIFNKSVSCLKSQTRACVPAGGTTPASRRRRPPPARHLAGVPVRAGARAAAPAARPSALPTPPPPRRRQARRGMRSAACTRCQAPRLHRSPARPPAPPQALAARPGWRPAGRGRRHRRCPRRARAPTFHACCRRPGRVRRARTGRSAGAASPARQPTGTFARCTTCMHAGSIRKIKHPSHQHLIRVRELHLRDAVSLQAPVPGGLRHTTARFFKARDGGGAAGEVRHLAGVAHARAEAAQRGLVAAHLPQRVRIRLAPPRPPAQGRCVLRSGWAVWCSAVRARLGDWSGVFQLVVMYTIRAARQLKQSYTCSSSKTKQWPKAPTEGQQARKNACTERRAPRGSRGELGVRAGAPGGAPAWRGGRRPAGRAPPARPPPRSGRPRPRRARPPARAAGTAGRGPPRRRSPCARTRSARRARGAGFAGRARSAEGDRARPLCSLPITAAALRARARPGSPKASALCSPRLCWLLSCCMCWALAARTSSAHGRGRGRTARHHHFTEQRPLPG